MGIEMPGGED